MAKLPPEVINQDSDLESQASKASEELAQHRWHWTLDESNPKRVSIRQYARDVGKAYTTIAAYVNGYASDSRSTITERIERAKVGSETETAIEAVAVSRGINYGTASRSHRDEAKRVREATRDAVESGKVQPSEFEDYAKKVAKTIHTAEQADQKRQKDRQAKHSLRYIELDAIVAKARRLLSDGLDIARRDIQWDEDELDLLVTALDKLKAVTGLIDLALTGALDVDWDAELSNLEAKS